MTPKLGEPEGGMSDAGDGEELDEAGDVGGSTEDFADIFGMSWMSW